MNVKTVFCPADILLPDFSKIDGTKWSVVACDQYTSQPEYWDRVKKFVGDAPSTLGLMLPEINLSHGDEEIPKIHSAMQKALSDVLVKYPSAMILLERTQADGRIRRGIVGAIDLEAYDYSKTAKSPIRATEGTVIERIPPRVKIRRNAPIEMPHVMLLFDDPEKTVIEPLPTSTLHVLYDFDLTENGGHVKGYLLNGDLQSRVTDALQKLCDLQGNSPLLFAVGDGNHSLASAKAYYEEIKAEIGDEALTHPARFALTEIVNLHDGALDFEPIYRVVFSVDSEKLVTEFSDYAKNLHGTAEPQAFTVITADGELILTVEHPEFQLPVATLQAFLDAHDGLAIDYIHGEDTLRTLAKKPNSVGFLFRGMQKEDLFPAVRADGALPRKTFSMGHAHDKRFYLECRRICK